MRQLSNCLSTRREASDSGFTLVELAVYIVLLGIVSAIVAAVVMTSFRAEQTVSSTTTLANSAQTVIAQLDRDVRNSSSVSPHSGSSEEIRLCVAGSQTDVTWHEVVWKFSDEAISRSYDGGSDTIILQKSPDSDAFTISDAGFVVSDGAVAYSFTLFEAGTTERTFSGSTALSPGTEEGCA